MRIYIGKELVKEIRAAIKADVYKPQGIAFKIQAKPFQVGQNWLGMIGYCQKFRDHADYRLKHHNISEDELMKGVHNYYDAFCLTIVLYMLTFIYY